MLSSDYVVGLVDGEGSFTIFVRNPDDETHVKRRVVVEPRFYLKLVERDRDILYQLKEFFSCGNVYYQKDARTNHQNCYRYEVANRNHLQNIIIPFFKQNPLRLASKKKDFEIFCAMMDKISAKQHLSKSGLKQLYVMKQHMH